MIGIVAAIAVIGAGAALFFGLRGGDDDDPSTTTTVPTATAEADEPDPDPTPEGDPSEDPTPVEEPTASEDPNATQDPTPVSDPPPATDPGADVGSIDNPAGLGEVFVWAEHQATVVEFLDPVAEGLLHDFGGDPEAGNEFVAIVYDVTYTGSDIFDDQSIFTNAQAGGEDLTGYACIFDDAALQARGYHQFVFEYVAGYTTRTISCFEVPSDQRASLVGIVENFAEFEVGPIAFSQGGAELPDPPAITATADLSSLPTLAYGETATWEEWTGTVVNVEDARDSGLLSEFGPEIGEGRTPLLITYDVTYTGTETDSFIDIEPMIIGEQIVSDFGACQLDYDKLEAAGIDDVFELGAGQSATLAVCLPIADDQLDNAVIRLAPFYGQADDAQYYPVGVG